MKKLYEHDDIQSLADSIKSKANTTSKYTILGLKALVDGLKTVFTTEEKIVTPTESAQEVIPTSADGFSKVTVNPISSTYVGSGITKNPTPTVSGATVNIPTGYYSSNTSKSVSSGTAGTPTATKGSVSNNQISITPSVTNTTGYISGDTKTGTPVTVSASELVSGSETLTENGTVDVTILSEVVVAIPFVNLYKMTSVPSSSVGSNGDLCIVKV